MSNLENFLLKIFIALDFSVYNLFWVTLLLWFFQAFVVYGAEKVILGKAIGLQWYDLFLTLLIGAVFCVSIYLMGKIKQKVGYAISIKYVKVNVEDDNG